MLTVLGVLGFLALSILSPTGPPAGTVALPGGSGGIGFDDLQFSRSLDRLLESRQALLGRASVAASNLLARVIAEPAARLTRT